MVSGVFSRAFPTVPGGVGPLPADLGLCVNQEEREGFALHPERPLSHMFVDDWAAVYARQRSPRFGRTAGSGP